MTKIKICGLMTSADIAAVNRAKPDLAGFIFAGGRHRIDLTTALKLRNKLNHDIPSVGVFVNAPMEEMVTAVNSGAVSMIQLHGQESETVVNDLQVLGIPVIDVFRPSNKLPHTKADYLMLDSGSGDGKVVNWQKLRINREQPLIIAGALNSENVQSAIQNIQPAFVDLSRGVETNGQKDPQKILEIVNLVHQL